jgi:hypothetical protein
MAIMLKCRVEMNPNLKSSHSIVALPIQGTSFLQILQHGFIQHELNGRIAHLRSIAGRISDALSTYKSHFSRTMINVGNTPLQKPQAPPSSKTS